MAKAKDITAINCPECGDLLEVPDELELDEVVSCSGCEADLVVTGLNPITVVVVDEEEDDDLDEDAEGDEEGEDDDDLDEDDDEED